MAGSHLDGAAEARDLYGCDLALVRPRNERLPELAADLVRWRVAVIAVGGSTPGALAAKAATQSVPRRGMLLRGSRLRNLTTPSPFAPRPMVRALHSAHPRQSRGL